MTNPLRTFDHGLRGEKGSSTNGQAINLTLDGVFKTTSFDGGEGGLNLPIFIFDNNRKSNKIIIFEW